ncbi:MAG TPA: hypothetical protein EYN54_14175 [Methylococcaceae bacterium]|nr:hypothetical protein [Methylococcaceae bacterium]
MTTQLMGDCVLVLCISIVICMILDWRRDDYFKAVFYWFIGNVTVRLVGGFNYVRSWRFRVNKKG